MAESGTKRGAPQESRDGGKAKKPKHRSWRHNYSQKDTMKPGDAGIFVTCNRSIERRCVGEVKDLFQDYATRLYPSSAPAETDDAADEEPPDIDAAIQSELAEKGKPNPSTPPLFENVNLDRECLVFFRTRPPLDPVTFVHTICADAASPPPDNPPLRTRFARRLTPLSYIAAANEPELERIALKALAPHFHTEGVEAKKFAVRPTVRDHSHGLSSAGVIQLVAGLVGRPHRVDLKGFEVLVLVEVWKNICGISVVTDFERLKRFNLSEIYAPTPKPKVEGKGEREGEGEGAVKVEEKPSVQRSESTLQSEEDTADGGVSLVGTGVTSGLDEEQVQSQAGK